MSVHPALINQPPRRRTRKELVGLALVHQDLEREWAILLHQQRRVVLLYCLLWLGRDGGG